jgi:hypothetical protein
VWKYFKEFDPSGYYPLVFAHENFLSSNLKDKALFVFFGFLEKF